MVTLRRGRRSLRGELTRWMLEVDTGVYVGTVSARVRDELWALVLERIDDGAALMLYTTSNEQGFDVRSAGQTQRTVVDSDGLVLFMRPHKK